MLIKSPIYEDSVYCNPFYWLYVTHLRLLKSEVLNLKILRYQLANVCIVMFFIGVAIFFGNTKEGRHVEESSPKLWPLSLETWSSSWRTAHSILEQKTRMKDPCKTRGIHFCLIFYSWIPMFVFSNLMRHVSTVFLFSIQNNKHLSMSHDKKTPLTFHEITGCLRTGSLQCIFF